jgi:hypothetical protein
LISEKDDNAGFRTHTTKFGDPGAGYNHLAGRTHSGMT